MVKFFSLSIFFGGFKSAKCKTTAKLAVARIKLLRNKREVVVKQMRRDIALLLQSGRDATARIRVEHVIREQNIMAANEIIELFCELIVARLTIIAKQRDCPADLKEGVSSLIFASPRCSDIPELLQLRSMFEKKYGEEFVSAATELRPNCGVNRTLIERLSVRSPTGEVKLKFMKEIAKEHNIQWDPAESEKELLKPPEDLIEGPSKFVSATSMPMKPISSHVVQLSQSASSRYSNDREERAIDFADTATAAKAAAESAEKAVAAAQAAAYLANRSDYHIPQTSGLNNGTGGLSNPFLRNSNSHSQSNEQPVNSRPTSLGNTNQISQTTGFNNNSDRFGNSVPSKNYVPGNFSGSSQSNDSSGKSQDSIHRPDLQGRNYESQSFNRSHYTKNEQVNPNDLDAQRINRRHSYNVPAKHSDIRFDESEGSDSDCDEEIEMETPSGEIPLPPNRPPPPLPASHAHKPDDKTRTDDSGYYKRHSLPRVHPKLPDYDELSARFEALKHHKP